MNLAVMTRITQSEENRGEGSTAPHRIVLRRNDKGEYVTHWHNTQDGGYYFGHYFTDLAEAVADFKARCAKAGVREDRR